MMGHSLINLARVHKQVLGVGAAMADLELNSSGEYSGSSAGETNSCVVGNSVWDEWTHASSVADEVSTSGFLPELTTMSSSSSRLAFHPTDMLPSWMSTLHPLALAPPTTPEPTFDIDPHPALFMHEALDHPHVSTSLVADPTYGPRVSAHPTLPPYPPADASPLPAVSGMNSPKASTALQAIDPQSPSSPLAIQNGMLNPLGDPWDGASRTWPGSTPSYSPSGLSRPRHTDIFIGPNGTFESTPGGWTPQFYDGMATETIKPMKMMESLREESTSTDLQSHPTAHAEIQALGRPGDPTAWLGKHRLELSLDGHDHPGALQLKRSKSSVGNGLTWGHDLRGSEVVMTYNGPSAMDMIALGPALNTNGKPRARRGSATDPQSVYARQRRERINDRLKTLQHLVPNGAKVDIVTMLDEAYDYVKFLQYQVTLLKSDEFWMHATPYSGMDISNVPAVQAQELESSA